MSLHRGESRRKYEHAHVAEARRGRARQLPPFPVRFGGCHGQQVITCDFGNLTAATSTMRSHKWSDVMGSASLSPIAFVHKHIHDQLIYANSREQFPAPDIYNLGRFSMAIDSTNQRVYWYINTGRTAGDLGSALSFVFELWSVDVGVALIPGLCRGICVKPK